MTYISDTHALVWLLEESEELSPNAKIVSSGLIDTVW